MEMIITKMTRDDEAQRAFGFAADFEGNEYFIPRHTILFNDLQRSDVGKRISAETVPNPVNITGKDNLAHVKPSMKFMDEEEYED